MGLGGTGYFYHSRQSRRGVRRGLGDTGCRREGSLGGDGVWSSVAVKSGPDGTSPTSRVQCFNRKVPDVHVTSDVVARPSPVSGVVDVVTPAPVCVSVNVGKGHRSYKVWEGARTVEGSRLF